MKALGIESDHDAAQQIVCHENPLIAELLAMAANLNLPPDYVAYTVIPATRDGNFLDTDGLEALGDVRHVIVQTTQDGRVMLRVYRGCRATPSRVAIGGASGNLHACWLNKPGAVPQWANDAHLVAAAARCLQSLSAASEEDELLPKQIVLPHYYAVYPSARLVKPLHSRGLFRLAGYLRRQGTVRCLQSPLNGMVTKVEPCTGQTLLGAAIEPYFSFVTLHDPESGLYHDVLVPWEHGTEPLVQPGQSVTVGSDLVRLTADTPQAVAVMVAWWAAKHAAPYWGATDVEALPMELAWPLHSAPAQAYLEDVAALLGHAVSNPAAQVRESLQIAAPLSACGDDMVGLLLAEFRYVLGSDAAYASDDDIRQALDNPAGPLVLRGLARVQIWQSTWRMKLYRPGVYADFQRQARRWEDEFGPMDPARMAVPPNLELQMLEAAIVMATTPRKAAPVDSPHGRNPLQAAAQLLEQSTRDGNIQAFAEQVRTVGVRQQNIHAGMALLTERRDQLRGQLGKSSLDARAAAYRAEAGSDVS